MTLEQAHRDQRRYKRLRLSLPAKFLTGGQEHPATLLDISAGGLALTAPQSPPIGAHIVVYVEELGRVEGRIVRHLCEGFAVEFSVTDGKRERLKQRLDLIEQGAEDEVLPLLPPLTSSEKPHFILADGSEITCRVLDMSVHGVSLQVNSRPALGEEISIGRMRGRVCSHHASGIEIAFMR